MHSIRNMQQCLRKCLRCVNCNFVSYSAQQNDCSWYSQCNMQNLIQGYGAVTASINPEVRRKAVLYSKAGAAKAPKDADSPLQPGNASHSTPHTPIPAGQISGFRRRYASSPREPQLSEDRGVGRDLTNDLVEIARHRLGPTEIMRLRDKLTRLLEGEHADPSLLVKGNQTLQHDTTIPFPSATERWVRRGGVMGSKRISWNSTTTPLGGSSLAEDKVHTSPSPKMPPKSLTVVLLASFTAIHPSTKLLSEVILSLRLLSLPAGTPVILSHQGSEQAGTKATGRIQRRLYSADKMRPRTLVQRMKGKCKYSCLRSELYPQAYHDHLARVERAARQGAVPPMWQEYLQRVEALIPQYRNCTGLEFISLIRPTGKGGYIGNIKFAMRHVQTPFVLKVEQDRECRSLEFPAFLTRRNLTTCVAARSQTAHAHAHAHAHPHAHTPHIQILQIHSWNRWPSRRLCLT